MTTSDKLREIARKHFPIDKDVKNNTIYNQIQQSKQDSLLSDLTALIEQVEEARMPTITDEEIEKQFPSGGLVEVTEDGRFNRPATIAMYDNLNKQIGAKWFRSRMKCDVNAGKNVTNDL